jgi:transposase
MIDVDMAALKRRFELLAPSVDERTRRLVAAAEAVAIGWGGVSRVSQATGVSRRAISQGIKELQEPRVPGAGRVRRPGGGRKRTVAQDPTRLADLERLVEPLSRGDPESPMRWTCKSLHRLAEELNRQGHKTSHRMVGELLRVLGYRLQANHKTLEGGTHPDRNAQFEHLNGTVAQ